MERFITQGLRHYLAIIVAVLTFHWLTKLAGAEQIY
jgi:hypothetical protein